MRSVGAVLALFWAGFVLIGTWFEMTEGPGALSWLMRIVAVPRDRVPTTVAPDGFGLYYHLIDPVPLFAVIVVPIIVCWIGVALWRRALHR